METNKISIRINLESREFEIEGDIKYIDDKFGAYIKECLEIIKSTKTVKKTDESQTVKATESANNDIKNNSLISDSFGEYFNRFPKTLSNVDKLLLACYYIQAKSATKSF